MTSKGTFTLPAKVRKQLGVHKAGNKLMLTFHEKSGEVVIRKSADLESVRNELTRLAEAKNISPLTPQKLNKLRTDVHNERWQKFSKNNG